MPKKKPRTTYKKRTTTKKPNSASWLIGGILIGLIIPSFLLLKSHRVVTNEKIAVSPNEMDISNQEVSQKKHKHTTLKKESSPKVAKYDFYDLVSPNGETASVDTETETAEVHLNKFQLEIATFNNFKEADELKAQLVLMGFEVSIAKNSNNKLCTYKVMAGPFNSRLDASEMQKKLRRNAINSTLTVG